MSHIIHCAMSKIIIAFNYFSKTPTLNLWDSSAYVWGFKYVRVLNTPRLSILQGSEYASGRNNGRVLNITGCRIWQISEYVSITKCSEYAWMMPAKLFWPFWLWQSSEYAWSKFHRVLNMPSVLNMPGELRIWQGCEYARVTKGVEYAWISLNIP